MKMLYLGPEGTFTEMAAQRYKERIYSAAGGEELSLEPVEDISTLAHRVENNSGVRGIIPIENSLEGSVNITLDMLAHEIDIKIGAELNMPVDHCLITGKDKELEDIEAVISHPQALAQCRKTLEKLMPRDFRRETAASTAEAVRLIKEEKPNYAAIGSGLAAERSGLSIAAAGLQDEGENWTRFIQIGDEDDPAPRRQADEMKTSLISIPVENRPGILYEILEEFALREINLTRIESRPTREKPGEYLFFIDFNGSRLSGKVKKAAAGVKRKSSELKLLGSYPCWQI